MTKLIYTFSCRREIMSTCFNLPKRAIFDLSSSICSLMGLCSKPAPDGILLASLCYLPTIKYGVCTYPRCPPFAHAQQERVIFSFPVTIQSCRSLIMFMLKIYVIINNKSVLYKHFPFYFINKSCNKEHNFHTITTRNTESIFFYRRYIPFYM